MTDLRNSFLHFPITDNPQQCKCNANEMYVLICNKQYRQIQASIKINSSWLAFWLNTSKWPRTAILSSLPPGPRQTEPRVPHLGVCLAHTRRISLDCPAEDVPVVRPVTVLNTRKICNTLTFSYNFAVINYHNTSEYCVISLKGLSLSWIVVGYNK